MSASNYRACSTDSARNGAAALEVGPMERGARLFLRVTVIVGSLMSQGAIVAAESETVMGMIPPILGMEAKLRARHPYAYVEDSASMSGYANETMNILDTLVTCEGAATVAIPEQPTPPPVTALPEGAVFEDSGNGSKSTAPFELETGDYWLTYQASAGDNLCSFGIGLEAVRQE
jgi:hypothetical protein